MSFNLNCLLRNGLTTLKKCRFSHTIASQFSRALPGKPSKYAVELHTVHVAPYYRVPFQYSPLLALSVLGWLGLEKPSENIEDELIMNIKWGILLLQRKDYKQSEKMFHLALRMAQQLQNQKAITYIYDMMANLAMETEQYTKAEKLFISVMERLLGSGHAENHIKNIHISLKIARCNHLNGNLEKANIGYRWVIDHLERTSSNEPTTKLLTIAKDWYGHCLYDRKQTSQALKLMTEAYESLKELNDENDYEELLCLVNDLGIIYDDIGDIDGAEKFIREAIKLTRKHTDDTSHLGTLYVNLGRIFLRKGKPADAHKCCTRALKYATVTKSQECIDEAKKCLNEIKKSIK